MTSKTTLKMVGNSSAAIGRLFGTAVMAAITTVVPSTAMMDATTKTVDAVVEKNINPLKAGSAVLKRKVTINRKEKGKTDATVDDATGDQEEPEVATA